MPRALRRPSPAFSLTAIPVCHDGWDSGSRVTLVPHTPDHRPVPMHFLGHLTLKGPVTLGDLKATLPAPASGAPAARPRKDMGHHGHSVLEANLEVLPVSAPWLTPRIPSRLPAESSTVGHGPPSTAGNRTGH